jgi:hypothetical protein
MAADPKSTARKKVQKPITRITAAPGIRLGV